MSEYLNKENILFKRGEDGSLLPIEVELITIESKPKIKCTPLSRGKFQELAVMDKNELIKCDNKIILENCKEPTFTEEEIERLPSNYASAITTAIMALSLGITQEEFGKMSVEKVIENQEYLLKKK